ncbi:LacI family DNA-binding transcriptional regulator [Kribbella sp. CA-245084]|uniref:LacI family DNA-binding transcriptional regulator n=1 Tax=Kribbella sp. CA-245084 TaxID=3239940 RepID=UPI003D8AC956
MSIDEPQRSATLDDVARAAGVSRSTASRVMNGSSRVVLEPTRRRVAAAASQLGYIANAAAQATARGRTETIAFLVNAVSDDYFSPIAVGVFRAAERVDALVTFASFNDNPAQATRIVSTLRGQRPQAIIIAGSRTVSNRDFDRLVAELEAFEREGGRVVTISQEGLPFDTVAIDNVAGGRQIARRAMELGYRRFAIFAGPRDALTARDRTHGMSAELAEHQLAPSAEWIFHSDFGRDGGYAAAGEYLRRSSGTDCILASSDAIAIGAMARFREAGVPIPEAVAISGFDDLAMLRDVHPALTTLHLPWDEVGEAALTLATRPKASRQLIVLSGYPVVRESTPARA